MKALALSIKDVVITENSDLGRFLGGRVLFPEKNELAKEHAAQNPQQVSEAEQAYAAMICSIDNKDDCEMCGS
ncbi:hypothetical protein [Fibrella forsythiae]|uniref:Uncharacterized protein n=1 Tax=Fibrella forsythiae TaxID=2817061 RepID=A0ABS3JJR4_9BACT|nr:hypothetical protein [Fibrella forsythiae]MBO0950232.1 hypothetical protein [Fibrella forsythiae]